jgi:hypothetical protein
VSPREGAMTGYIERIKEIEIVRKNVVGKSEGKITRVKSKCA